MDKDEAQLLDFISIIGLEPENLALQLFKRLQLKNAREIFQFVVKHPSTLPEIWQSKIETFFFEFGADIFPVPVVHSSISDPRNKKNSLLNMVDDNSANVKGKNSEVRSQKVSSIPQPPSIVPQVKPVNIRGTVNDPLPNVSLNNPSANKITNNINNNINNNNAKINTSYQDYLEIDDNNNKSNNNTSINIRNNNIEQPNKNYYNNALFGDQPISQIKATQNNNNNNNNKSNNNNNNNNNNNSKNNNSLNKNKEKQTPRNNNNNNNNGNNNNINNKNKEKQTPQIKQQENKKEENEGELYVSNIPFSINEQQFKWLFETELNLSGVVGANLPSNNKGKIRGYGFIQFDSKESCAIAFDTLSKKTITIKDRTLEIQISNQKSKNITTNPTTPNKIPNNNINNSNQKDGQKNSRNNNNGNDKVEKRRRRERKKKGEDKINAPKTPVKSTPTQTKNSLLVNNIIPNNNNNNNNNAPIKNQNKVVNTKIDSVDDFVSKNIIDRNIKNENIIDDSNYLDAFVSDDSDDDYGNSNNNNFGGNNKNNNKNTKVNEKERNRNDNRNKNDNRNNFKDKLNEKEKYKTDNRNNNEKKEQKGKSNTPSFTFLKTFTITNQNAAKKFITACMNHEVEIVISELSINFIARVNELVEAQYDINTKNLRTPFSFQKTWIPFVTFLMDSNDKCLRSNFIKLLDIIYHNNSFFWKFGIDLVGKLIEKGSFIDPDENNRNNIDDFVIENWNDILYPICKLLFSIIQYITDAPANDSVKNFTITLRKLYDNNLQLFKSSEIESLLRRCAVSLSIEVPTIKKKPQNQNRNIVRVFAPSKPPGELNEEGARHDNDFVDYRRILIIPTQNEILSTRDSFLPRDFTTSEFLPMESDRYLDQQFRLIREDSLYGIKSAISYFINQGFAKLGEKETSIKFSDERDRMTIMTYRNVNVEEIEPSWRDGVICKLTFEQFSNLKNKNERGNYWEFGAGSKLLQQGALVCLILEATKDDTKCNSKSILLATVVNSRENSREMKESFSSDLCKVDLKLVEKIALNDVLSHAIQSKYKGENLLLEVRGYFFLTSEVILKSLQNHNRMTIPFPETVIESQIPEESVVPRFLRNKTFSFNCIRKPTSNLSIRTEIENFRDLKAYLLARQEHITLDPSQIDAFVAGLTQQIPLIQGPPGTGKTYVGVQIVRFLLDNFQNSVGNRAQSILPILCVCYTNHALDQFLMDLIESGVAKDQIVRVGTRSKCEELAECGLHQRVNHEKREKYLYAMLRNKFTDQKKELDALNRGMNKISRKSGFWEWLESKYPGIADHMETLYEKNCEMLEEKNIRSGYDVYKKIWITEKEFEYDLEVPPGSFWGNRASRNNTHSSLVSAFRKHNLEILLNELQNFTKILEEKQEIDDISSRRALSSAKIVGITTSSCAKYQSLLKSLKPKVVICEEAGEVLESHILASINADTLQLMLIGDHLQLRPKIENYFLSSDSNNGYSLDISLFERLIKKFQTQFDQKTIEERGCLVTLQTQRRMRPAISSLIRETLYPNLLDHQNVREYPDLLGFSNNLWFVDHDNVEQTDRMGISSFTNEYEIQYIVGLIRYLIRQGYTEKDDIVVLTPYLGQLLALRNTMAKEKMVVYLSEKDLEEISMKSFDEGGDVSDLNLMTNSTSLQRQIRLSTVDNFQGEEAKVVIISTVRSNKIGKIGFLKSLNRVNVMLSRAKHGMILLGSSSTVFKNSKETMFAQVLKRMKSFGLVSPQLHLKCQNHNEVIIINSPADFKKVADGGCDKECKSRLECGHLCKRKCHSDDKKHRGYPCKENCSNKCDLGHKCPKMCSEKCLCNTLVSVTLRCGHSQLVACHKRDNIDSLACRMHVEADGVYCDHPLLVTCDDYRHGKKYLSQSILCRENCNQLLECGHICTEECGRCNAHSKNPNKSKQPILCKQSPKHPMPCGHSCTGICGHANKDCPQCTNKCSTECVHSQCPLKCNEACSICSEKCGWECTGNHPNKKKCNRACGNPCDRLPCDLRCELKMTCGHQCTSICGEICPKPENGCPLCANDDVKKRTICLYDLDLTLETLDPDESQIIQLPCGHVYTVETLDGLFKMNQLFYTQNGRTGEWDRCREIKTSQEISEEIKSANCPVCKSRILKIFRYGRALSAIIESDVKRKLIIESVTLVKTFQEKRKRIDTVKESLKVKEITKIIAFITTEFGRLKNKDPTKKISDLDPDLSHRVKQFNQPLVMIMIEYLNIFTLYFKLCDAGKRDKRLETEAFKIGADILMRCKDDNLMSKYKEAKALVIGLMSISSIETLEKSKDLFTKLGDEDFVRVISTEELKMIFEAMKGDIGSGVGSFGGHWKECPNGHMYCIGECGGAMQESKCPDCGATIGGQSHRLHEGNRDARDFFSRINRPDLIPQNNNNNN